MFCTACRISRTIRPAMSQRSHRLSCLWSLKAGFYFGEFDRMTLALKTNDLIGCCSFWSRSTSRTGRAFASECSLSAWISSCACPDSPSLGCAPEFAEVETGLQAKQAFAGECAVRSGSWIKFNFFATRMSENQSDCFFSMLEHATVPVRATKFAEVETGLKAGIRPRD